MSGETVLMFVFSFVLLFVFGAFGMFVLPKLLTCFFQPLMFFFSPLMFVFLAKKFAMFFFARTL